MMAAFLSGVKPSFHKLSLFNLAKKGDLRDVPKENSVVCRPCHFCHSAGSNKPRTVEESNRLQISSNPGEGYTNRGVSDGSTSGRRRRKSKIKRQETRQRDGRYGS